MHLLPKQELGNQQTLMAVVKTSVIRMKMMMMVAMMTTKIHVFYQKSTNLSVETETVTAETDQG